MNTRLVKGELKMNIKNKSIFLSIFIIINFIVITALFNSRNTIIAVENNSNTQDRLEKIKAKGVLTVASSNDEPTSFINPKTKQLKGIDGDIITEVAKRLGVSKVQMKEVPFEKLFDQIQIDDDIDIIADGTYVTDERRKKVLFTNKWYKNFDTIITPKVSRIVFKEYTPEIPRQVAAAVRKSDITLSNAINEIIDDMKKKGTILDILKKYGLDESFYIPIEEEKIE
jgi:ABC-type amino acid transport substrate-binding protein